MAGFSQQQLQAADSMINGSFDAVGAKPAYMSAPTSVADMYRGIYAMPSWGAPNPNIGNGGTVGSPAMTAQERALLQQQIAQSQQLQQSVMNPPTQLAGLYGPPRAPPIPAQRPAAVASLLDTALSPNATFDDLLAYAQERSNLPGRAPVSAPQRTPPRSTPIPTQLSDMFKPTATPSTNGYTYSGGKRVGVDKWAEGLSPAQQYENANTGSMISALGRQSVATGHTGVYNYVNGKKVGTVNGQAGANAYAAAVSRNNSGSGTTSSGAPKTKSDGSSWAA